MPDASMDTTLNALVTAGFGGAGQKCMALSTVVFVGGLTPWYHCFAYLYLYHLVCFRWAMSTDFYLWVLSCIFIQRLIYDRVNSPWHEPYYELYLLVVLNIHLQYVIWLLWVWCTALPLALFSFTFVIYLIIISRRGFQSSKVLFVSFTFHMDHCL